MYMIYLASSSPRRADLLHQAGVEFKVLPPDMIKIDETCFAGESPVSYVGRLALAKAQAGIKAIVLMKLPLYPVLGADTTVCIDGQILGKPCDTANPKASAYEILDRLSGRGHQVFTAVSVQYSMEYGIQGDGICCMTEVQFRSLLPEEINQYIEMGEPLDKAGAYAIQGRAGMFVRSIRGSYSSVVGLPLCETLDLLQSQSAV